MQKFKQREQKQITKQITKQIAEEYKIEDYIDVVREITSPYHLYIKKDDIGKDVVHFIIYNIGKEKKIIWGIYTNDKFIFLNGCKYKLRNLMKYISSWQNIEYEFTGDIVKNRIKTTFAQYGIIEGQIENYEEYKTIYLWYKIKKKNDKANKFTKYINKEIKNKVLSKYNEYASLINIKNMYPILELYEGEDLEEILKNITLLKKKLLKKVKKDIKKYENGINLFEKANEENESNLISKLYEQIKRKDFNMLNDCEDDILKCEYTDKFVSPECSVFFHGKEDYDVTELEPSFL